MELTALNGSAFKLEILGYQFPEIETCKWDSNWLIIQVTVAHPKGNWTASDACLLTFEMARLADWLENIGDGKEVDATLHFLEPKLIFHLVHSDCEDKALRACFQSRLRPPWEKSDIVHFTASLDDCDLWVQFPLNEIDLKTASRQLREQMKQFPTRFER
jgi:hypothetical protein